jgi:L-seryl-tRNA(Ser) seleniumtransferase
MYLEGRAAELPLWRLAEASNDELERRARAIAAAVEYRSVKVEAVPTRAVAGGGSVPGRELPSWAVSVVHGSKSPDELARALRFSDPAVIGRIDGERVLLDLRTVPPQHDEAVVKVLQLATQE